MLYGSAPLWNLGGDVWDRYRLTFVESYRKVCPWLQQIGYDELVSHRFLTPDHTLQESVFSSGKRVVVNFSPDEASYQGKIIEAKGFAIF